MNYGYQPYGNYNNTYSNYNPYYNNQYSGYQGFQQNQTQSPIISQQQQNNQQSNLQGWYVDGFDVTKSINADMSGNAMYFPSTDGKEIYKKQLDINTGKSFTYVYKLENNVEQQNNSIDFTPIYSHISEIKDELSNKMSELKDMVLDNITTPPKKEGGK